MYKNDSQMWYAESNKAHELDKNIRQKKHLEELVVLTTKLSAALSSLVFDAEQKNIFAMTAKNNTILFQMKLILARRRKRDEFLYAGIFADPAWDMLLDLSVARLERRQTSVSSLCIGAAVPTTTALRWIRQLEQLRMILVTPDPFDKRRHNVDIVDETFNKMLMLFNSPL